MWMRAAVSPTGSQGESQGRRILLMFDERDDIRLPVDVGFVESFPSREIVHMRGGYTDEAPSVAMAQESWKQEAAPEAPILCINNCGFFGSSMTNNMCSKCYRDFVKLMEVDAPVVEKKVVTAASSSVTPLEAPKQDDAPVAVAVDEKQAAQEPPKPPSNRCLTCRKKVGLTGFQCRCGGTFCSMHRYTDAHQCTFDYKKAAREQIAKQNPVVIAEKINKI
ncbi:hypothetical protein ACP70R_014427 [Stipagrostis hirtigluma subsp. patula]